MRQRGQGSFMFRNGKSNPPNANSILSQQSVSFSSGMTSEQKFNSIAQKVRLEQAGKVKDTKKGCMIHPKASVKCRKCQAIQNQSPLNVGTQNKTAVTDLTSIDNNNKNLELITQFPTHILLNTQNPKSHINAKLQTNIITSQKFKQLKGIKSVKEVLGQLTSEQITIEAYKKGSVVQQTPSDFMAVLFRIIQLKPTLNQLVIMLRDNNINVRALALIYVRICMAFEQIYGIICHSFEDNKLINAFMTVGQLAQRLLKEEQLDIGGIRLPRIPTKIQKQITTKLTEQQNKIRMEEANQRQFQFRAAISQKELEPVKLIEQKRSRSRERRMSKSSSSSSSYSSSSDSSSESQEKSQKSLSKIQINKMKQGFNKGQSLSLEALKAKLQKPLQQEQQKQKRQQLLAQKYNAAAAIQNQNDQEQQYSDQSQSVQKYQMN